MPIQPLSASPNETAVPSPSEGGGEGTLSGLSHNGSGKSIVRNALVGYFCLAIGLLSGVVITPILLRLLGAEDYGLWLFVSSLIGYLGLAECGIGGATSRRVAAAAASDDAGKLGRVLSSAFALYVLISVVAVVAACALALSLPWIGRIPKDHLPAAQAAMLLLGIGQAVNFLLLVRVATIVGLGRMDLTAGFGAVASLLGNSAQVGVLLLGYGILGMALVTVCTTATTGLYTLHIVRKRFPEARVRFPEARVDTAKELLRFGGRNAVVAVCGTLAFQSDAAIIGFMLPLTAVAHYAIAAKVVGLLKALAMKPIDVLLPTYAHAQSVGDTVRMERLFVESTGIALAIALPGAICLAAFGTDVFQLWLGGRHPESYPILLVLSGALLMQLPGHASFTIFTGTDRTAYLLRTTIAGAICNVALSLVLTRTLGLVGPALGTLITVALVDLILLPRAVCRVFGFNPSTVFTRSVAPVLLPGAAALTVAVALMTARASATPFGTLLSLAIVTGTFGLTWLLAGLPAERRQQYLDIANKLVLRNRKAALENSD